MAGPTTGSPLNDEVRVLKGPDECWRGQFKYEYAIGQCLPAEDGRFTRCWQGRWKLLAVRRRTAAVGDPAGQPAWVRKWAGCAADGNSHETRSHITFDELHET